MTARGLLVSAVPARSNRARGWFRKAYSGHFDKNFARQFDTTAFTVPPNDGKGLTQTGVIRSPGQLNMDLSVGKTLAIYDRLNLNFRADVFNAFNHTQRTNVCNSEPFCYDNSGNQVSFGTVSAGREGRIMQMGQAAVLAVMHLNAFNKKKTEPTIRGTHTLGW